MDYRSKLMAAFGLILLLLVGKISILTENDSENDVKTKEKNQSMSDNDDDNICTFYNASHQIDNLLFQKRYKPLIVIIAREFTDGINRVRSISQSRRISDPNESETIYSKKMHTMIRENFYLFEAHNVYYFVYPINIIDNFFTIYCQKMLLSDQLGVTFDFVNVKKEDPFYEDILVPLKPNCSYCLLVEYVNKKLKTGKSFSELFKLRDQLFRDKTKYTSLKAFDNDFACDSIGFNINSESESFLMHFNTLLQQIQDNNEHFYETKKKQIFERSLKCFNSTHLIVTEQIFKDNILEQNLKHPFTGINYLKWINKTVFSLNVNDISYGNICKNKHKIYLFKLFCFIKDISDITSYNIAAWTNTLQQLVAKSLSKQLKWFNSFLVLHQAEYFFDNFIFSKLQILHKQMLNETKYRRSVMNVTYNLFINLIMAKSRSETLLSSPCLLYNYLDTIDVLLPEMKFKRLVIIVVDSMRTGIWKLKSVGGRRVEPKIKREDLHYTKQFVHDEIMKHFYLIQSNDTYYYVYPLNFIRYEDALITYFEYKMIRDYSKVVFYFANYSENFLPNELNSNTGYNEIVIPALPDNCRSITANCKNRFLSPMNLILLHQEFHKRYSKYLSAYAMFYNKLPKFFNNDNSHYKYNNYIEYELKFNDFLKTQQISYRTDYLLNDFPCSSLQEINKRINIDFDITEIGDFRYIYSVVESAYKNITSINITDIVDLKYFCLNSNIFPFIKFFCFLKINYIEGIVNFIDIKSNDVEKINTFAENEKKVITEYLSTTLKWMNEMFLLDYIDIYIEGAILEEKRLSYSKIPKIISNGADSFDKFSFIVREAVFYSKCKN